MSNNPEELRAGPESSAELEKSSAERIAELDGKSPEKEMSPRDAEALEERAREKALESAISVEAGSAEKKKGGNQSSPAHRRGGISKAEKNASYKRRMKEVQSELTPGSRAFSKVIHNKVVEKTSETVGATVARPNAILAGAISAFFLTLAVYVIAKTLGYKLSGFETIAAFIIGWVIGIVYDYLRVIITGKK